LLGDKKVQFNKIIIMTDVKGVLSPVVEIMTSFTAYSKSFANQFK